MDPRILPFGQSRAERADAARNRRHLLLTAREILAEDAERIARGGRQDMQVVLTTSW